MPFIFKSLSLLFLCLFSAASAQSNATGSSLPGAQGSDVFSNSTASTPFWLEDIKHQGGAAFRKDFAYQVFRRVKDVGAKGLYLRFPMLSKHLLKHPKGMAPPMILRQSF